MIKVGVLGCASIARRSFIPAFVVHPDFTVTAVASRSAEKAEPLTAQYGMRICSYEELVTAEDVDLVYCPLPTGLHYVWVKRCLEEGKHVVCEKSLACGFAEVEELVAMARAKGLLLLETFQFRFHAQNLYVRELLKQGAVGPLRQVVIRFGIPPFPDGTDNIRYSKELGGGALLDNGAYTVKAATYLFGSDLRILAAMDDSERCRASGEIGADVDLCGSIMMRTGDGVCIQTAYGFDHFYQNGYEIWGRDGKISTVRAFTARNDFAAPVILETLHGREERRFCDDHFANLLSYVARIVKEHDLESEYEECLCQARLMSEVREAMK